MGQKHSPTDDLQDLRAVFSATATLTATERAVSAVLILHRNGDTSQCNPSLKRIAEESGLGRSTVARALAGLEAFLHVERTARRDGRTRTDYTVKPPTSPTAGPVPERDQSQSGTTLVPQRDQGSPRAGPERTKERTKERADVVLPLWQVFVDEMDGAGLKLTGTRRQKLTALYAEQLKDAPDAPDAFRRVLRAVKRSDHHMGTRAFHLPESLFRCEERRERWAEAGRTAAKPSDPLMLTSAEIRGAS